MSKPIIKFFYGYSRLLDSYGNFIQEATLLQVLPVDINLLTHEYLSYETDGKPHYFSSTTNYLMLIFIKPEGGLFSTLCQADPKGFKDGTVQIYYDVLVGRKFRIIVERFPDQSIT